jgi:3',5'-cyclic AMP phosphodiesterase CpdA
VPTLRVAEYPRPDHILLHLSDAHLIAGEERLYGAVDADTRLRRLLDRIEAARIIPSALVFTGDLVDAGEPAAYRKLRATSSLTNGKRIGAAGQVSGRA